MFRRLRKWLFGCNCSACKLRRAAELLASEHAKQAQRENRVLPTGGSSTAPRQSKQVAVTTVAVNGHVLVDLGPMSFGLSAAETWRLIDQLRDAAIAARNQVLASDLDEME